MVSKSAGRWWSWPSAAKCPEPLRAIHPGGRRRWHEWACGTRIAGPASVRGAVLSGWLLAAGMALISPTETGASVVDHSLDVTSRSFDDAQFRKDSNAIRRMVDPALVYISGSGRIGGAAEFLAAFSDPGVRFGTFRLDGRRVLKLSRDVGVVTGEGIITGTDRGVRFRDHFRFSDTFALRAGRWRPVYIQVTRLPN